VAGVPGGGGGGGLTGPPGEVLALNSIYLLVPDFKGPPFMADFKGTPGGGGGLVNGVEGVTMGVGLTLRSGVFSPGSFVVTIMNLFKFDQIRVLRQFENLKIGRKNEP
jgi:hypothetical protein